MLFTSEIYTLSLHDALPIWARIDYCKENYARAWRRSETRRHLQANRDRKSTRLNSSHVSISYAVFCLKKKNSSTDYFASGPLITYDSSTHLETSGIASSCV